jgi:hypothetical protein
MNNKKFILSQLILLVSFVFLFSNSYGQSKSSDCADCLVEQAKYDSISPIYIKAKAEFKAAKAKFKKDSNSEFAAIDAKFTKIKNAYQSIVSELESCLNIDDQGECVECKDGKLAFKNGAPCDDGDPCTKNDRCVNGVCIGDPVTSNENPECAGGRK